MRTSRNIKTGIIIVLTLLLGACEPPGEESSTELDAMHGELSMSESAGGMWGLTPSGSMVFVETERLCENTRITPAADDWVESTDSGDGFVVYSKTTGASETLICDCTKGADTACAPLWNKKTGMVCAMSRGCSSCTKIIKKNGTMVEAEPVEKKKAKKQTKTASTLMEASEDDVDSLRAETLWDATFDMAIMALEDASVPSATVQDTCLDGSEADVEFEEARKDLFATVYGDAGLMEDWHVELSDELDFIKVYVKDRPVVMPVPRNMITDSMNKVSKPKSCTCLPKETPKPEDTDKGTKNAKSSTPINIKGISATGGAAGPACKLESTWGYYSCERQKSCKTSCAMEF